MARTMSVGDVLDKSFRLYRQAFPIFLGLGALYVPVTLGLQLVSRSGGIIDNLSSAFLTTIGLLLVVGLIGVVYSGAICWASFSAARGERPRILASMAKGFSRLPSLAIAGFVVMMALWVGMCMCLVPGFILWAVLGLYVQAIVIERSGPFAALGRSASLTEGSRWRTLCIILIPTIIVAIIEGIVTVAAIAIMGSGESGVLQMFAGGLAGWHWYVYAGLTALTSVILGPLSAIPQTVLFMSLRDAKEGAELEHMVDSLIAETPKTGF